MEHVMILLSHKRKKCKEKKLKKKQEFSELTIFKPLEIYIFKNIKYMPRYVSLLCTPLKNYYFYNIFLKTFRHFFSLLQNENL